MESFSKLVLMLQSIWTELIVESQFLSTLIWINTHLFKRSEFHGTGSMHMIEAIINAPTHGTDMPLPAALAKAAGEASFIFSFGDPDARDWALLVGMHWEANISAGVKHRFFTCKGMESEKIQIYFNCLSVFLKGESLFVNLSNMFFRRHHLGVQPPWVGCKCWKVTFHSVRPSTASSNQLGQVCHLPITRVIHVGLSVLFLSSRPNIWL